MPAVVEPGECLVAAWRVGFRRGRHKGMELVAEYNLKYGDICCVDVGC